MAKAIIEIREIMNKLNNQAQSSLLISEILKARGKESVSVS